MGLDTVYLFITLTEKRNSVQGYSGEDIQTEVRIHLEAVATGLVMLVSHNRIL